MKIVESFAKLFQIDRAGLHDLGRIRFIDQRQKQMLQRGEFMPAGIRDRERRMNGVFERLGKTWHALKLLQQGSEGRY